MWAILTDTAGNIALLAALAAATLTILDFLLSKKIKAAVSNAMIHIWGWLTDQNSRPYVELMTSKAFYYTVVVLLGLALGALGLAIASGLGQQLPPIWLIPILGVSLLVGYVGYSIYRETAQIVTYGDGIWSFILRSIGMCVVSAIVASIFGTVIFWSIMMLLAAANMVLPDNPILGYLVGLVLVVTVALPLILTVANIFAVLYVVLIAVLMAVFRTVELLVARLVEYDRGPVVAAVVVLGAAGSALKLLSS